MPTHIFNNPKNRLSCIDNIHQEKVYKHDHNLVAYILYLKKTSKKKVPKNI